MKDYKILPITKLSLPSWDELKEDFKEIIESGFITNNRKVKEFEAELANYLNVPEAVCVSSGSLGLILSLKCLKESGKLRGNEVILPSFTFIASANAIEWAGLTPRFVDCERDTFNIDPEKIQEAINDDTAAVMPVHTFGNPCEIKAIGEIVQANDIKCVWDSCEAFGAKYHLRRAGSFNHVDVTSGAATKVMSISEAGIIGTEDVKLAALIREARNAGNVDTLKFPGTSARMTEFQAVMGLHQIPKVDGYVQDRNRLAGLYKKELADVEGISVQHQYDRCKSSWFSFPVIVNKKKFGMSRDDLQEKLNKNGIWSRTIWFYPHCNNHPAYKNKYIYQKSLKLPNANYLSRNILCMPMWSHMNEEDVVFITDSIRKAKA